MLPARTATGSAPAGRPASARCRAPTRTSRQRSWPARSPTCRTCVELPGRGAGRRPGRPGGRAAHRPARRPAAVRLAAGRPARRRRAARRLVPLAGPRRARRCPPGPPRPGQGPALRAVDARCRAAADRAASRCSPTPVRSATSWRPSPRARSSTCSDVRRRLPDAPLVLQLDEPSLPAVLAGGMPLQLRRRSFQPVPSTDGRGGAARAGRRGAASRSSCTAARTAPRWRPAAPRRGERAVAGPDRASPGTVDDELGEAVDGGVALLAGVVPAVPGAGRRLSDPAGTVEPVRRLWRRLGLPAESLRAGRSSTPTCGLAGADPRPRPRRAAARRRRRAEQLADDPEG